MKACCNSMKNKLIITTVRDSRNFPISYKVHDNYTVYMLTSSLSCAEETVRILKLEYNQEKQNASKV